MIGIERMLLYILSVSKPIPLRTLNIVLVAKEKEYQLDWSYKRHLAQSNWITAQCNCKNDKFKSFEEIFDRFNSKEVEEVRNAEEIIKETYAKFGVEVE